jgi:hypothetical protein
MRLRFACRGSLRLRLPVSPDAALLRAAGTATFVAYFLKGTDPSAALSLKGAQPGAVYSAVWFDPRGGGERVAPSLSATADGVLPLCQRPDAGDWLLIARALARGAD